jgi:hypothetical protein
MHYHANGVRAVMTDYTYGGGGVVRLATIKRRLRINVFVQPMLYQNRVDATVSDSYVDENGGSVEYIEKYRLSDRGFLLIAGPTLEFPIPHFSPISVRLGRIFGGEGSLATDNAGGMNFAVGTFVNGSFLNPVRAFRKIRSTF